MIDPVFRIQPVVRSKIPGRLLAVMLVAAAALHPAMRAGAADGPVPDAPFPKPPMAPAPEALVAKGKALYTSYACDYCHGPAAEHWTASLPDLRRATQATYDEFAGIVIEGTRSAKGMPRFAGMSVEEAGAIRAYVLDRAWAAYQQQVPAPR